MFKDIGRDFMEKTKYKYMDDSDQDKGLPQPKLQFDYDKNAVLIELPPIENFKVRNIDIRTAIESRKTVRKYSDTFLTLEELSYLLWCTQAVKQITANGTRTARNVPSAGARHAVETYLLINKVKGLEPGLYRYLAIEHKLLPLRLDNEICEDIISACHNQVFIGESAVTFIWSADIYRMKWRYGERGYRYLHLDAGHICQNLYLAAELVDSGVCAIAAFDDDKLNDILNLDGENLFAVYLAALGKQS